jgi:thymidylate synthase ThyX
MEWFSHINVVVTSTEWENFYGLRDHTDAQPEIQALAQAMKAAHDSSTPKLLQEGEWHLPYVSVAEISQYSLKDCLKMSAARSARVSYLNHDQSNPTPEKDFKLHDQLTKSVPPHMSPVEHQSQSRTEDKFFANFRGWKQYRGYLEELGNV